jgi:aspartate-semialdehyde dehydrogenase
VGQKLIQVLSERRISPKSLKLYASNRSAGQKQLFEDKEILIEDVNTTDFSNLDVVFFSAGTEVSQNFCPKAVKAGAIVIDNTNAFRMDENVPLIIPEVNPQALANHHGLIANPNCSTIQMLVAIAPIHRVNPIKRIVVSTYQSVSGTGNEAIDILKAQCKAFLENQAMPEGVYKHPIGFNLFPHIDIFLDSGLCREEEKMIKETWKIMGQNIPVCPTTVRVPIISCHSESINLQLENPFTIKDIRTILEKAEDVVLIDDPASESYPTPLMCEGKDEVFVGRIRKDESITNGLNLWVVADNLRRGAATNAVKIYQKLVENGQL